LIPELDHHPIKKGEEESKIDEERWEREAYTSLLSPLHASLGFISSLFLYSYYYYSK
jgi:hypothetical protein